MDINFASYVTEHLKVINTINNDTKLIKHIDSIVLEIIARLRSGKKILVCGNGGSAADAQHIVAELVGKFFKDRAPIRAISLTTNTSTLTAWSNDETFDEIFSRQVMALGDKDDILLGISTSGNSVNVCKALIEANKLGMYSLGLIGKKTSKIDGLADQVIKVPSEITPIIQEAHIMIYHYICARLEADLS